MLEFLVGTIIMVLFFMLTQVCVYLLEVYSDGEYEDFDYYIRYEDYEGKKKMLW